MQRGISAEQVSSIWALFNRIYFLRHRSSEITWHTEWLNGSDTNTESGLVDVRQRRKGDGIEAVLFTPRTQRTFAHVSAVLDELGMTIMDARIVPLENGYSIDTFVFMEQDERIDFDESRMSKIRRSLTQLLTTGDSDITQVTRTITGRQ